MEEAERQRLRERANIYIEVQDGGINIQEVRNFYQADMKKEGKGGLLNDKAGKQKGAPSAGDAVTTCDATPVGEVLFQFIHPEVEESEEKKIHQSVKKLVRRFGVKEICEYLAMMAEEKKILLPQSVKNAYDELLRMGMPEGEGYAYKTFEKYYTR